MAGTLYGDNDYGENDLRYLEEVIFKVKSGYESQFQISDYIEALLNEINGK